MAPSSYSNGHDFKMLAAEETDGNPQPARYADPLDLPEDDWPFLYLMKRALPRVYLIAMCAVLALVVLILAGLRRSIRGVPELKRIRWMVPAAFLLMGIAFSLLETKSIIQFSLLFGTTWLNNSLVFLSVLLLVLAANVTAARWTSPPLTVLYAALAAGCLIVLVFPLGKLLFIENIGERFLAASFLTFTPIYLANLLFSATFRDQAAAEHIFGWNLIGAMLGGVIEYASLVIGYNSLSVIVVLCYSAAFVLFRLSPGPHSSSAASTR